MASEIEHLSRYLTWGGGRVSIETRSIETRSIETRSTTTFNKVLRLSCFCQSEADPEDSEDLFILYGPTCLVVICFCYAVKKTTNFVENCRLTDTIRHLNNLASEWSPARRDTFLTQTIEQEFSQKFVNVFLPEAQNAVFTFPKLSTIKYDEILVGFIQFLIQILNSVTDIGPIEERRYALLQKKITVLLTFLGDTPLQCIELEQVKNLLEEFESLANEVGHFIYSFVFVTRPFKTSMFYDCRSNLLEKIEVLNIKIKEHYGKFSELPLKCRVLRADVVDSHLIIDSVLEDLQNLMNSRYELTYASDMVDYHIKALHYSLKFSQLFIKGMNISDNTNNSDELEDSLIEIRNISYEAEFLINSYVLENVPDWCLNLRLPAITDKIALISTRFQEINKIYDNKALHAATKYFNGEEGQSQAKVTPKTVSDNFIVGYEEMRTKMLGDLIGGSKSLQTISIFGMPGLGKTTIANALYNDRAICDHFYIRGWTVVSQNCQNRKILIDILTSLAESMLDKVDRDKIMKMEDENLGLEIHKYLMGRRYLIVIDDVWNFRTLDDLRIYFPDNGNRSRVMLTSRIKGTSPTHSIFHPLPLLSELQCLDLLVKKVFPKIPCPPQLLGVAKRIAVKCHGLPLAVVVTAGILENLEHEEHIWEKIEGNLDSYVSDDPSGYMNILELSYEHLPSHLKPCFLYLGAFPEDTEIPVWKLTWLWIAEGFIQKEEEKSPEHVAEKYLFDLIDRSLVSIAKTKSDGGIKACGIHDLLRDMCIRRAHQENFMKSMEEDFPIYEKCDRLYVRSPLTTLLRPFPLHCRSFLGYRPDRSSCLPHMPLLRVIDLLPSKIFTNKPEMISLLVHLRYLGVHEMRSAMLRKLINLEFLCIEDTTVVFPLNLSSILKMVKLRHMRIKYAVQVVDNCSSPHQTTNLKSLSYVWLKHDNDGEILKRSPHLCKLKCICGSMIFPDLRHLTELESLKMVYGYPFKGGLLMINFPLTLKKLSLCGIGLPWKDIAIIGRLPCLQVLKLVDDAFYGEEWETRDGEFQELRFLKLEKITLKQWTLWSDHFPKLEFLLLHRCSKLLEIPSELGDIPTLKMVEVRGCSSQLEESTIEFENEQLENGNNLRIMISKLC